MRSRSLSSPEDNLWLNRIPSSWTHTGRCSRHRRSRRQRSSFEVSGITFDPRDWREGWHRERFATSASNLSLYPASSIILVREKLRTGHSPLHYYGRNLPVWKSLKSVLMSFFFSHWCCVGLINSSIWNRCKLHHQPIGSWECSSAGKVFRIQSKSYSYNGMDLQDIASGTEPSSMKSICCLWLYCTQVILCPRFALEEWDKAKHDRSIHYVTMFLIESNVVLGMLRP